MIDTREYYGGTYPDPPELEEDYNINGYESHYADEYHELMMLGEIK